MRVILAPVRAASIALRNPDALVIDIENQCIRRGADRAVLGVTSKRTQIFQICAALCCAVDGQVWRSDLFDLLYADDPDGGPLRHYNVVAQLLCHIKPFLTWAGLRLVCRSQGRIEVIATTSALHGQSLHVGFDGSRQIGAAA